MTSRSVFLFIFIACAAMLGVAAYFQFVEGMEPCPLCIFQRVVMFAVGVVALLAVLHSPYGFGNRVYGFLVGTLAVIGGLISARHVWIQNLPADQVPTCGPGLSFMLDNFPLMDALKTVLTGSGECAEVLWKFAGLTVPGWTLVAFAILAILGWWQVFRSQYRRGIGLNVAKF